MKYIIHTKGHYGIEDPELQFSKKGLQEDSYQKRTKVQKAQKVQIGMGMRNKRIMLLLSVTILWCLGCNYQRAGKINLIHLASKELFIPKTPLMLPFSRKDGLLLSNLMHKLACLGIQTSRRFRFYSDSLKLGERVNS